jgi:flap endonuclease GEN
MGVKTLWSVLSGSGEMIDLRELQGQTVAVDLAGWIVQNNTCKGMSGVVRPHLRNLFFRTSALISLNIRPIFVLDGDAPDLKKETLAARRRALSQVQSDCLFCL